MREYSNRYLLNLLLPAAISFGIYMATSSGVASILPLLLMRGKLEGTVHKLIPVGIASIAIVILHSIQLRDIFQNGDTAGILIVGLFMPLSLMISSGIWIASEGERMFRRFVTSVSVAVAGGFFIVLWLLGDSAGAQETLRIYQEALDTVMQVLIGSSDSGAMSKVVNAIFVRFALCIYLVQFGGAVYVSELLLHKASPSFEKRMIHWRVPHDTIWVLLGALTLVMVTFFVESTLIESVAYNISGALALLYGVHGISIAVYLLKSKVEQVRIVRMFNLSIMLMVLPGINVVMFLAFALLGISETWITYRKHE